MNNPYRSSANRGIHSWILFCLVGAAIAVCTPHVTHAQTAIFSNVTGTIGGGTTAVTYGYGFTVGSQPILVTSLGLWDHYGNGLVAPRQVGLWSVSGQLEASVTIPGGTAAPLLNDFRYVDVTPVMLSPTTTYYIGFENDAAGGGEEFIFLNETYTIGSGVSFEHTRTTNGQLGFSFPDDDATGIMGPYIGPNALYTAVPEPSTYAALFGLAALGFAAYRRRLKQSA